MTHPSFSNPLKHLERALAALEEEGLRRYPPAATDPATLSFCSNDYLGLARRSSSSIAVVGAGASRLIAGERAAHGALERAFASWLGTETSVLFSSGYAANVGTLAALAGPRDVIISDALNHASLIDGARLSRARVVITKHNDVDAVAHALERKAPAEHAWVVVESYYSMDADGPDLAALRHLSAAHGAALFVDEAHALGVLGPKGRGRCFEAGIQPDVLVGTLGKAFGSQGAIVAGSAVLRDWLWNRARSFVFSTGLAPVSAVAAKESLDHLQAHPDLVAKVGRLALRLREGLAKCGSLEVLGFGHIVPVIVGSSERTMKLSSLLREESGIDIPLIRPPTVPSARLRLTVTAAHHESDIDRFVEALARALERVP